jgi:hypothetical protein
VARRISQATGLPPPWGAAHAGCAPEHGRLVGWSPRPATATSPHARPAAHLLLVAVYPAWRALPRPLLARSGTAARRSSARSCVLRWTGASPHTITPDDPRADEPSLPRRRGTTVSTRVCLSENGVSTGEHPSRCRCVLPHWLSEWSTLLTAASLPVAPCEQCAQKKTCASEVTPWSCLSPSQRRRASSPSSHHDGRATTLTVHRKSQRVKPWKSGIQCHRFLYFAIVSNTGYNTFQLSNPLLPEVQPA